MKDVIIIFDPNGSVPMNITDGHIKQIETAVSGEVIWCLNEEEALKKQIDAEYLFIWGGHGKMPVDWCRQSKRLKMIYSFSAGIDPILESDIAKLPVKLTTAKGIMAKTMAITVIGYVIGFLRCFPDFFYKKLRHEYSVEMNRLPMELEDLSMTIIGAGVIGSEVARVSKLLGMRVIGVKQTVTPLENFDEVFPVENMNEAISQGDFVISLIPLSKSTYHLMDYERFKCMKPSAVFINISRGKVVNERDLIKALQEKIIYGAALDCFEEEPLPFDSPLWDMENVIITPHFSAPSIKFMDRAIDIFCENLIRSEKNEPLINEIVMS